ncbi:hypothetical protein ACFX12_007730 [Malus domestica]
MKSQFSKLLVATAMLMFLSLSLAASSSTCKFPAIFNFGYSNSDTGGLSALFGQARLPHGESYFHSPAGRYCDGRLVIDFIANSLELPFLSAYLNSVGSNFTHGANFATAGSTIRPQNTNIRQSGFSPLMPRAEDFSRALYTFDIGQNDLTSGLFLNMSITQVKAYVPDVLNQFNSIVEYIYSQGGRYFWIHNTGPIGCLPYVLDRLPIPAAQHDKARCATPYNKLARFFNRGLKQAVVQLRKELPLAAITYVDVYSAKYSLISQPQKHGFKQPIRACCGHGGKYNFNKHIGCGGKIRVHGKDVLVGKACQDPSLWVNWDGVHFTEAANKRVFDQIVDGSLSDPPTPLKFACHGKQQQTH